MPPTKLPKIEPSVITTIKLLFSLENYKTPILAVSYKGEKHCRKANEQRKTTRHFNRGRLFSKGFLITPSKGITAVLESMLEDTIDNILALLYNILDMKNRVKEYRLKRGLSQEELSKLCGIPRTTISAIESGKAVPSVDYAIKLSKALGCSVEELFVSEEISFFLEGFREGPFISSRVGHKKVLYSIDSKIATFLPPDGIYQNGQIKWFERRHIPTYIFVGCDTSLHIISYKLIAKNIRFIPFYASSEKALKLLKKGYVHLAGVHLGTLEENLRKIKGYLGEGYTVLKVFSWEEGIMLREGISKTFKELNKREILWLVRERGTGSRKVFEELSAELGSVNYREITGGHRELAFSLKNGFGDAGVGTKFFAYEYGLGFLSVKKEDYCICYRQELEEDEGFSVILTGLMERSYREFLKSLPGYYVNSGLEKFVV